MTTGGWINMILSVGFVTVLFTWCIIRVLRGPGAGMGPTASAVMADPAQKAASQRTARNHGSRSISEIGTANVHPAADTTFSSIIVWPKSSTP